MKKSDIDSILFVTDPLHMLKGAVYPAILLGKHLAQNINKVALLTKFGDARIICEVENLNLKVYTLQRGSIIRTKIPTFDAWLDEVVRTALKGVRQLKIAKEYDVVVNTSSTLTIPSDIYYGMGPMIFALNDMLPQLKPHFKFSVKTLYKSLARLEFIYINKLKENSKKFVANSIFAKQMYRCFGIEAERVIYPPVDAELFRPTTSKPAGDYVLTYLGVGGKEGIPHIIKNIADRGIKIKAFGLKALYVPKYLHKHKNIEFLGYVNDSELIDLYSNALYTLFTFTHEPFGYVPVESMSCGTPVLTYNKQGPSETVINDVTGWLANDDEELVKFAVKVWEEGYPSISRSKCRERAKMFDVKQIAGQWLKLLKTLTK